MHEGLGPETPEQWKEFARFLDYLAQFCLIVNGEMEAIWGVLEEKGVVPKFEQSDIETILRSLAVREGQASVDLDGETQVVDGADPGLN
jgi:hypothetical protein